MEKIEKYAHAKAAGMRYGVHVAPGASIDGGWYYGTDLDSAKAFGREHDGLVTNMAGRIIQDAPGTMHL